MPLAICCWCVKPILRLRDYGAVATGSATSVKRRQDALFEYMAAAKTDSAAAARQKYTEAYQALMKGFKNEVDIVTSRLRHNRATILSRPNRALEVARRSGRVAKL